MNDLRLEFLKYLAKIYDNDARKEGAKGCHLLI